jgi:tRNA-specific 2-thiouridylase
MVEREGEHLLMRGKDSEKDQSYFLWTLTKEQRADILFPIGDTKKSDIRKEAKAAGLPTHAKEDSQGICFLGEIDMKEFLMQMVDTVPGIVLNEHGEHIGTHDGALLYTIGQRHGFAITDPGSKEVPQYVVSKDIGMNTVTVSPHQKTAHGSTVRLGEVNWIGTEATGTLSAQFRYRQKPFGVSVEVLGDSNARCTVQGEVETPSLGQSCVFYDGDTVRGGGIIDGVE